MCGIAGIISNKPLDNMLSLLKKMSDAIAHRGPDGEGQWSNGTNTVGLAHRRLSIIDMSENGAQPMHYQNRYSITYNGEIYNYKELRAELEKKGHQFVSATDTEVLLGLYAEYGHACLTKLDGMFAFAIYDEKEQVLFCARDRFGEKPFFYKNDKQSFYFGSEMKALWAAGIHKEENPTMQYNYLAYGFLKNPKNIGATFYRNIYELPPAHFMTYDIASDTLKLTEYYQIHTQEKKIENPSEQLRILLNESVAHRLRSDVAVGCSLSGGLDSSLIATLIKDTIGEAELKTFSAVFPGYQKDESAFITATAKKINCNSFVVTPSLADYESEKERFLWHQEEPVVDESPFILYKVYELARKNNSKVLLDGQGADEIFAGYHAYYFTYLRELRKQNRELYTRENKLFKKLAKSGVVNDYRFFRRQNNLSKLFGNKLSDIRTWKQKIDQLRSQKVNASLFKTEHKNSFKRPYHFNNLNEHLQHDATKGKLQTLLRYADRSAMAHGVEIRLPYLSHKVVDLLFSLPAEYKIKEGWTKWILRDAFSEKLPKEVAWRRDKVGAEGELK